jgi:hypothetical protein
MITSDLSGRLVLYFRKLRFEDLLWRYPQDSPISSWIQPALNFVAVAER